MTIDERIENIVNILDEKKADEIEVFNLEDADYNLNVKTPIPQGADYYVHGNIPANQHLIIDPSSALMKVNAQPMMVESERIVSNQTQAFYASFTTGFAKMFTDACLIQDMSKDFAANGFPTEMEYYGDQNVVMS